MSNDFRHIPNNMRPCPLWFWNDSEVKPDELVRQMQDFKKAGYGGLSILPFGKGFKPEYLSEAYFNAYRICIEEAKKSDLRLCIYDEYGFPSGTAGDINGDGIGRFKLKYPQFTNKRLDKSEYIPSSGTVFETKLSGETLLAAVAMDTINYKKIDLDKGNISWTRIFSIAMDQYVKGINILIPHAVWYNTGKVVFRPELSLRNPIYADSLPAFTGYLSRLNVLLRNDARWSGDVAILYPIHTMQSGHYLDGPLGHYKGGVEIPSLDYINVSVNLFDSLGYDHLFIHPEVLDKQCVIEKNKLKLNNKIQYNSFSTIIVPSCGTLSLSNLEKIRDFARSGGIVIFTSQLPDRATLLSDNEKVKSIVNEVIKLKNVYLIENPTVAHLQEVLSQFPDEYSIRFLSSPVRNIHKILYNKNIWFFVNPVDTDKITEFDLNGKFKFEIWDPHSGTISGAPVHSEYKNGKTRVKMNLGSYHSLFLIEK